MVKPTNKSFANSYPEKCITCGEKDKKHSYRDNGSGRLYYRKECNSCSNAKRVFTPVEERIPLNAIPEFCNICGKSGVKFPVSGNGHGKWYYRPTCSTCKSKKDLARSNAWRDEFKKRNPEEWKRIRRNQQLKRNYKMTLVEYEDKLRSQGGGCAICGRTESFRDMPVDHCHTQGHVRAILCHYCNKGLGQFFDNPDNLRKAADYIDSWVK